MDSSSESPIARVRVATTPSRWGDTHRMADFALLTELDEAAELVGGLFEKSAKLQLSDAEDDFANFWLPSIDGRERPRIF